MSSDKPSRRSAVRAFVVFALAAVVIAYCLPDIRRVWLPVGVLGWVANANNVVTAVEPNLPADKAGLKVGDRIDVAATDPEYRFEVAGGPEASTLIPGQQVVVAVAHGAQERIVNLKSVPDPISVAAKTLLVGRALAMLLFVGIGAALVLLRPSIATWAFYFFCLGMNGAADMVLPLSLRLPWNYVVSNGESLFFDAGLVGVLVFALLFLHEQSAGWRATVFRIAPFALLAFSAGQIYLGVGGDWFGWPVKAVSDLFLSMWIAATLGAMYALVETYVLARGSDRQRIRWVVVGFGIALTAFSVQAVLNTYFNVPYWLYASLSLVGVVVPLTVGYAVIRHRIIDVSFVVSRALVYGILTTLLVGIFSLIDWFFTDYLRLARLGTVAEVGAVVAFGLWFNGLHRRVDSLIDATFFRQRHRAEVQLARSAAALPHAPTTGTVAHFLINEPVRALSLASAALFRRGRDGAFVREASQGWGAHDLSRLDATDDPLLTLAQTEDGPLSLYDHPWRAEGVPHGAARPVLVLPIIVRRDLEAIALYGAHEHGEALDPDEIKAIAGLATGAAAAYDHLEAEALRSQVDSLRAQLAEAQIQPA